MNPEQAFRIMMELGEPYRALVFFVAGTELRISEALGLKWSDLDYDLQMIHLRRVWVGNWCFRQLDLAPFDRFVWPHLLVNPLSAPGRSEALRRPKGDAFRA